MAKGKTKEKSTNLDSVIQIRFKSSDLARLRREANRCGLKLSQYIRMAALGAVKKRY